jgi:DNA repair protein RecO (recombination protein O)|tara:strand:+ start:1064 stop:1780 length:717 start_codon:yes stop_codon:yes gene_type:complete
VSKYYTTKGIVLRTYKLREADRIIVLISPDRGMIRAVAKGIRKTKSKFGSRLEPTTHVSMQVHKGKGDLDLITQVETLDHFRTIREDLNRLTKAIAMLEAVDQVVLPGEPAIELHRMLLGALKTLEENDSVLVTPSFYLKLLVLEGSGPIVDQCVVCGATDIVAFSNEEGGVMCETHRTGIPISAPAIDLLRLILGGQLGKALNEKESHSTKEIEKIAREALEYFLERRMRTTTLLDT